MYTLGQDIVLVTTFSVVIGLGILVGWGIWGNDYIEVEVLVERVVENPSETENLPPIVAEIEENVVTTTPEEIEPDSQVWVRWEDIESCKSKTIYFCTDEDKKVVDLNDKHQKEIDKLKADHKLQLEPMMLITECVNYQCMPEEEIL